MEGVSAEFERRFESLLDQVGDAFGGNHEEGVADAVGVERGEDETPDEPDEYYDSSLTGCTAVLVDGSELGEVTEVLHLPSQDMLVVRLADERDVLIPFVSEIVPEVDIVARRVVVDPPVGLLDPPDA
jgi:16S rRNA processing protein RimM